MTGSDRMGELADWQVTQSASQPVCKYVRHDSNLYWEESINK